MKNDDIIKKVAVLGLGTLGAQIALQAAAKGYDVRGYDPDAEALSRTLKGFRHANPDGLSSGPVDLDQWQAVAGQIKIGAGMGEAVRDADLIIEAVPENLEIKKKIWAEMDAHCSPSAILATNSSSMPVSRMEGVTKRPERCLNIHFYHLVLGQNMADVMGGTVTAPEVLEAGIRFVERLNVIPLRVNKESLGFCFNRVWRAIKREALHMWADGLVDYRDVDRGWMVFTKTPWGPFGLMDNVGLDVIWDIEMVYYRESNDPRDKPPQALKDLIESGRLGVKTGHGFYQYPDPEFAGADFLSPEK